MVQIGGYGDKDALAAANNLKVETDKDNAQELMEYQNAKNTVKEAIDILEKIQANE